MRSVPAPVPVTVAGFCWWMVNKGSAMRSLDGGIMGIPAARLCRRSSRMTAAQRRFRTVVSLDSNCGCWAESVQCRPSNTASRTMRPVAGHRASHSTHVIMTLVCLKMTKRHKARILVICGRIMNGVRCRHAWAPSNSRSGDTPMSLLVVASIQCS